MTVYDLAVDVVLYLIGFQRRVDAGETISYQDTRAEVFQLMLDLDRRSESEPGLRAEWVTARFPLVYLIDEIMIINCHWPHQSDWGDEPLEVVLLGNPKGIGGEEFYRLCDEAIREFDAAQQNNRSDLRAKGELLMVFYVALQCGFKGQYAIGDANVLRDYKAKLFAKLPAYDQTRLKELFPEAKQHTKIMDPNYEPVTRLVVVFGVFAAILGIYMVGSYAKWNLMIDDVKSKAGAAQQTIYGADTGADKVPAAAPAATRPA